eukprot:gene7400-8651_t
MYKLSIIFVIIATLVAGSFADEPTSAPWELAICTIANGEMLNGTIYIGLTDSKTPAYTVWVNLTGSAIPQDGSYAIAVHETGDLSFPGSIYQGSGSGEFQCAQPTGLSGALGNWGSTVSGIVSNTVFQEQFVLNGAESLVGRVLAVYSSAYICEGEKGDSVPPSTDIIGSCVIGNANVMYPLADEIKVFLPNKGVNMTAAIATTNNAHNNPDNVVTSAVCYLAATGSLASNVTGYVTLTLSEDQKSITYLSHVSGLNTSIAHGINIHTYGDIHDITGYSAAGHWKLSTQIHALPENPDRELGDLGNMCVYDKENVMYYNYTTNHSGTFTSINNVIGKTIIVHAIRDYGNGSDMGARLSQCVIGIASIKTVPITFTPELYTGNFTDEPFCPVTTPAPSTTTTTSSTTTTTTPTTTTTSTTSTTTQTSTTTTTTATTTKPTTGSTPSPSPSMAGSLALEEPTPTPWELATCTIANG